MIEVAQVPEYEDYIIGCLCKDGTSFNSIYPHVTVDDFKRTPARLAYEASYRLATQQKDINLRSIFEEIILMGEEIPDHYLLECQQVVPTVSNASEYAKALHEHAERERFAGKLKNVSESLLRGTITVEDALQKTERAKNEMFLSDDGIKKSDDAINSAMKNLDDIASGKIKPLYSGFRSIDNLLDGFCKGGLYIIGARPGSGKTTFALNVANNMTAAYKRILFVSLEMTTDQIVQCRLQMVGKINSYDLRNNARAKSTADKIKNAENWMRKHPMDFNTKSFVTIGYLEKIAMHKGYDCIIVDYLQLIRATSGKNQYEKITGISNGLKGLAVKLDIPIICLSQLNRRSGETGEPEVTDLRDSGSIEQDADGILLLHLYARSFDNSPSILNVRVPKNRYGSQSEGSVPLDWYMQTRIITDSNRKG